MLINYFSYLVEYANTKIYNKVLCIINILGHNTLFSRLVNKHAEVSRNIR